MGQPYSTDNNGVILYVCHVCWKCWECAEFLYGGAEKVDGKVMLTSSVRCKIMCFRSVLLDKPRTKYYKQAFMRTIYVKIVIKILNWVLFQGWCCFESHSFQGFVGVHLFQQILSCFILTQILPQQIRFTIIMWLKVAVCSPAQDPTLIVIVYLEQECVITSEVVF